MTAFGFPTISLGLALAGLDSAASLRERLEWAASLGFRGVGINAAEAGARPRELGRSARRDLASVLRRHELLVAGVDLWIPPAHYLDAARADRAMSATIEAIDFTAELASLAGGYAALSLTLPQREDGSASLIRGLEERCLGAGVRIADCTRPVAPAAGADHDSPIGVGFDPASAMEAEAVTPEDALIRLGSRVVGVRLTDLAPRGGGRVAPGEGRLDLPAFLAALSTLPNAAAVPIILDLEGVRDQSEAARLTLERCGANFK